MLATVLFLLRSELRLLCVEAGSQTADLKSVLICMLTATEPSTMESTRMLREETPIVLAIWLIKLT